MGFFSKIKEGLKKTRTSIGEGFNSVFSVFRKVDEDFLEELMELLIMADVGYETSERIIDELRKKAKLENLNDSESVKAALAEIIAESMRGGNDLNISTKPSVILVVGVNGVGKTTTIGKLAHRLSESGKKVIIGAADTFRAAAIDQIAVWAERSGTDIVKHKDGADPAAVVYDTIAAAKARNADVIICDTAGRLHNKKNLMDELGKIYRVIDRELPWSDREILLVLDATTGQNAVNQAREFMNVAEITGIALTKLDGTARGGVVLAIKNELKLPVKFIGVGEGIDDLQPFDPSAFAKALFENTAETVKEDDEQGEE